MDVDDRKRAQDQVLSTADELRRVLSSISDWLLRAEIDERRDWKYDSPAVEKITGSSASFFLENLEDCFWIVPADNSARVVIAAERLTGGQVEQAEGEYRVIDTKGEVRWIRDSRVATRSGTRIGIDGVVSNVTEGLLGSCSIRSS